MGTYIDSTKLYRLPWTLPDNAISWLEPTSACNLYCDGCYRKNDPKGHKSLEEVRKELETFSSLRKTDGVSIAGGDPLTHPEIEKIVEMVAETATNRSSTPTAWRSRWRNCGPEKGRGRRGLRFTSTASSSVRT